MCSSVFLKNKKIEIFSATLQNSNSYHTQNYTKAAAIAVGTEATGLTQIWRDHATQNIIIPMQNNRDTRTIIQSHLRRNKVIKIIKF